MQCNVTGPYLGKDALKRDDNVVREEVDVGPTHVLDDRVYEVEQRDFQGNVCLWLQCVAQHGTRRKK
jgi:hypothetical protein